MELDMFALRDVNQCIKIFLLITTFRSALQVTKAYRDSQSDFRNKSTTYEHYWNTKVYLGIVLVPFIRGHP